jgi:Cysteine-rich secretory protein family
MPARSRPAVLFIAALGIACVCLTGTAAASCSGADLRPNATNIPDVEAATLCLLNEQRAANGLRPLARNDALARASRTHSEDMVSGGYFEHLSRNGATPRERIEAAGYAVRGLATWTVGENIAWGTSILATPARVVDDWMRSPGHRANILRSTYREVGAGVALGVPPLNLRGFLGATYTTDFGYRRLSRSSSSASRRAKSRRTCKRTRSAGRSSRCRR